ncbi:hypothetical protein MK139_03985 [bacterium]|nr:hypothetical protein [bacterium]
MKIRLLVLLFGVLSMSDSVAANTDGQSAEAVAWEVLGDMTYTDDGHTFHATFSPRVKRLQGADIIMAGYMIPIEPTEKHSHFVMTGLPLVGCTFCGGDGKPETYVEVKMVKPLRFSYDPIVLRGKLTLTADNDMGLFYTLKKARPASLPKETIEKLLPPVTEPAYQLKIEEKLEGGERTP